MEEAFYNKRHAAVLLMDVKGAFDHICHKKLIRSLQEKGADANVIRWVHAFVTKQRIRLVIDSWECDE